jgi:hypothetical protein
VCELEKRIEQLQREVQQKALQVDNLGASQEKHKRQEQDIKRQVSSQPTPNTHTPSVLLLASLFRSFSAS